MSQPTKCLLYKDLCFVSSTHANTSEVWWCLRVEEAELEGLIPGARWTEGQPRLTDESLASENGSPGLVSQKTRRQLSGYKFSPHKPDTES